MSTTDAKPARRPITEALTEAMRLHRVASMQAEGSTTGTGPKVSGSKPGSADLRFGCDLPLSVEMERSFRRYLDYWTARSKAEAIDRPSDARKALTRAILGEVGMDPTAVAFVYGSTTEAVKKLRGRNGCDPDTGQPVRALNQERIDGKPSRRTPLTAPARVVQDQLDTAEAEGGGIVGAV